MGLNNQWSILTNIPSPIQKKMNEDDKLREHILEVNAIYPYKYVKDAILEFEDFVKKEIETEKEVDIKLIMLNFREIFGEFRRYKNLNKYLIINNKLVKLNDTKK